MPVAASDLILYAAANMPTDNASTAGGAIDTSTKVTFSDLSANDTIDVVSDDAGDTSQSVTVTGRKADGAIDTDTISLNGTTTATGAVTFERILKVTKSASTAGVITVSDTSASNTLVTMEKTPSEIMTVVRPLYDAAADASGGSTQTFYVKAFYKNTNGSTALTNAVVKENADPSGNVSFALANTLDDSETTSNRKTAPGSVTAFDDSDKNVANSQNLSAGSAQGVWFEVTLAAGEAAANTSYTVRMEGTTT